jgi:uncharacterized damage-inducible protein DinB
MEHKLDLDPGLDPSIATLLETLRDSTREWREQLGKVPVRAMTWEVGRQEVSIGGILIHMIASELWWIKAFGLEQPLDQEEKDWIELRQLVEDQYPVPFDQPLKWYFEQQDRMRERCIEAIRSHGKPEIVRAYKGTSYTFPWMLAHIVGHDSYHGGQMVMLHELFRSQG